MPSLANVFSRISGGAASVSASDAQKRLMKAGGFGIFSPTGSMLKKGIETALNKADKNGDGQLTVDEFTTGIRDALKGKALPAWPGATDSLAQADLAELVKAAAKQKGGALGSMVDADGVARVIIAVADDNGDGKVSKGEFDALAGEASAA